MRIAESPAEPWRPTWAVTWAGLITAALLNLGAWYFEEWNVSVWGAGFVTGIALTVLGNRLENPVIVQRPDTVER